jgi:hypothetical protein
MLALLLLLRAAVASAQEYLQGPQTVLARQHSQGWNPQQRVWQQQMMKRPLLTLLLLLLLQSPVQLDPAGHDVAHDMSMHVCGVITA